MVLQIRLLEQAREFWGTSHRSRGKTGLTTQEEHFDQILKGLRVETRQTSVCIDPGRGVKLADLLPLLAKNGL